MKKRLKWKRWVLLAVVVNALLVYGGEVLLRRLGSKALAVVPSSYPFLMFPTTGGGSEGLERGVIVYESVWGDDAVDGGDGRLGPATTGVVVGRLERAVLASRKEVLAGWVGVNLPGDRFGYVRVGGLSFIASDEDEGRLVDGLRAELPIGGYTWIRYEASAAGGGGTFCRLEFVEDKYARARIYKYLVVGGTISVVYEPELRHGIIMAVQLLLFVGGVAVILALAGIAVGIHTRRTDEEAQVPPGGIAA